MRACRHLRNVDDFHGDITIVGVGDGEVIGADVDEEQGVAAQHQDLVLLQCLHFDELIAEVRFWMPSFSRSRRTVLAIW